MAVDINKIKVGDTVFIKNVGWGDNEGYGKIVCIHDKYTIGVKHCITNGSFHTCFESCEDKYGWFYTSEELELTEFKVGDIVFIEDVGGEGNEGYGKIVYINNKLVGVCHCTSNEAFHTCNKNCPNYYGWFYTPDQIRIP